MKLENITSDIDVIYTIDPDTVLTVDVFFYDVRNAKGHVHKEKFLRKHRLSLREIAVTCAELMQSKGYKKARLDSFSQNDIALILAR